MFFYHYTPAIALLVIILAYWLLKLPKKLRYVLVGLVAIIFIVWYPNWVGLPVSRQFADHVYFFIESWR
jgi:dolichyl-phosphate-mannose--protein O-mannosyl transferase